MKMRAAVLEEFGQPLVVGGGRPGRAARRRGPRPARRLRRLPHRPLHRLGRRSLRLRPSRARPRGRRRGREDRPRRRRPSRRRPRRYPLLAPVPRVRPLRRSAHQPLHGDPRRAEPRPPPRRHHAAGARRRGDPPLHGLLDLRRVHGDAGDRAGQDLPRGTLRARLPVRLRALDRARRGDQHRRGHARLDLRRLRRRDGRPRRRRRGAPAGRRADRLRRPLARAPRARQAARAPPTSWTAAPARSKRSWR